MQATRLSVVRQASYVATAWKNGGGITREAAREPFGADRFRWRVSLAQIATPGPFSNFAGYRRTMVLLQGNGVALRFASGEPRTLRLIGEHIEFDGAAQVECDLLDGPCVDLNLMVAASASADARVVRMAGDMPVGAGHGITLIFPIDAALSIECADGESAELEPWDLAVLRDSRAVLRAREASLFIADVRNSL